MQTVKVRHINKGFLSNENLYKQTVDLWNRQVMNILDNSKDYKVWLNNKTSNGKLIMDANPIFSIIKKDNSKALRIIQDEPRSKNAYMQAWNEIYDEGENGSNIPVLVVSLELSNKTQMDSLNLIKEWFDDDFSKIKFKRLLSTINKKYANNYVPSEIETTLELHDNLKKLQIGKPEISNNSLIVTSELYQGIQTIYYIYTSWDKYFEAIQLVNKDLGTSLHTYMSALYGLVSHNGVLTYDKINKKATFARNLSTHYNPETFSTLYCGINSEIEKLNDQLLEELIEANNK